MKIEQVIVGYMAVFCYLVYDEKSRRGYFNRPGRK